MFNRIPDSIGMEAIKKWFTGYFIYKYVFNYLVTISFIPTGLCLGHLFFLPWIHQTLYDEFHVWPYFTLLFAIMTTASIISIIKLSNGKYIFEHFIYLSAASVLFIISGILFIVFNIESEYDTFIKYLFAWCSVNGTKMSKECVVAWGAF